jgi:hypothetical protein
MSQPHGGLSLTSVVHGAGATREAEIHEQWKVSADVDLELEKIGCYPPVEPTQNLPELDIKVLTTPNSAAFTEAFAARLAWLGTFWEILAKHQAKLLEIKAEMADIDLRIRDNIRRTRVTTTRSGATKPPSVAILKEGVENDPRYKELSKEELFHEQMILRLGAKVKRLEAEQALTSRQVEIRRQDWEGSNRVSRVQGAGGLPVSGGQPMRRPVARTR